MDCKWRVSNRLRGLFDLTIEAATGPPVPPYRRSSFPMIFLFFPFFAQSSQSKAHWKLFFKVTPIYRRLFASTWSQLKVKVGLFQNSNRFTMFFLSKVLLLRKYMGDQIKSTLFFQNRCRFNKCQDETDVCQNRCKKKVPLKCSTNSEKHVVYFHKGCYRGEISVSNKKEEEPAL